jgi:hypothetical protein
MTSAAWMNPVVATREASSVAARPCPFGPRRPGMLLLWAGIPYAGAPRERARSASLRFVGLVGLSASRSAASARA